MTHHDQYHERRREIRIDSNDILRWKRPGRFEDHKGWALDKSPSGIGFLTFTKNAPTVGDVLHIRREEGPVWAPINGRIRVASAVPASGEGLVFVGCEIQRTSDTAQ